MDNALKCKVIVCSACGLAFELFPNATYRFDVANWSTRCSSGASQSPIFCQNVGPHLNALLVDTAWALRPLPVADKDASRPSCR